MLSFALHAAAAALVLWLGHIMSRREPVPIVFELVAGEGDNFAATVAPALGTTAPSVDFPDPPIIQPEPARPQPAPIQPAPVTPAPPPKVVAQPAPNFSKQIKNNLKVAEAKTKREIARERAAEAKRQEEEKKKLTKAEFDRLNRTKSAPPPKKAPPKIVKIDAAGISKGVIGGSTNNKTAGAGGKALKSNNDDALRAYFAMFRQRVRERFEAPPGLSESLLVEMEFRSHSDGTISSARVLKSSGSRDFDEAVLHAIRRVTMPARPDRKTEMVKFEFTMRERDEG